MKVCSSLKQLIFVSTHTNRSTPAALAHAKGKDCSCFDVDTFYLLPAIDALSCHKRVPCTACTRNVTESTDKIEASSKVSARPAPNIRVVLQYFEAVKNVKDPLHIPTGICKKGEGIGCGWVGLPMGEKGAKIEVSG